MGKKKPREGWDIPDLEHVPEKNYLSQASGYQVAVYHIRQLAEILYARDEFAQQHSDAISAAIIAICEKAEKENEV